MQDRISDSADGTKPADDDLPDDVTPEELAKYLPGAQSALTSSSSNGES
jgi:hypothetical protein